MTLIGWLVILEIIVGLGLIIWYARHAHKHVKKSPAEEALRQHLAELETSKVKKSTNVKPQKKYSNKVKKS